MPRGGCRKMALGSQRKGKRDALKGLLFAMSACARFLMNQLCWAILGRLCWELFAWDHFCNANKEGRVNCADITCEMSARQTDGCVTICRDVVSTGMERMIRMKPHLFSYVWPWWDPNHHRDTQELLEQMSVYHPFKTRGV